MKRNLYRVRFHTTALADRDLARFHALERKVGGFYLTETNHPPGFRLPTHSHDNASFYLVLKGSLTEKHGKSVRECGPSTLVFTPPGDPHSNYFHEAGGRCFMVEIKPIWLKSLAANSLAPNHSTDLRVDCQFGWRLELTMKPVTSMLYRRSSSRD